MNLIAAVDENWAIGKNNQLLVRIPADQKFFREMTTGRVVVMGRKTLESFPNGQPLKNRTNIVLTHNKDYAVKDAVVVHSMDELHEELKKYDSDDVFVIGGEKIYEQLLILRLASFHVRGKIVERQLICVLAQRFQNARPHLVHTLEREIKLCPLRKRDVRHVCTAGR